MTTLDRVTVSMTGFSGAPGYMNFYLGEPGASTALPYIRDFLDGIKVYFPSTMLLTIPGEGDTIEDTTGQIDGTWATTTPDPVAGLGSGAYSGASGAVVNWNTSGISNGRRVRGRTFLVPLTNAAYQSDGSLDTTAMSTITTEAQAMVLGSAGALVVWSRPVVDVRPGSNHAVVSASVPDMAAVLRSRRD